MKINIKTTWVLVLFLLLIDTYAQDKIGSFEYQGNLREYEVYLPQNFEANMPVVFALHGYDETIQWFKDYTLMHELGDTSGFITVYPVAIKENWNTGSTSFSEPQVYDVGFISELIDTLNSLYAIDMSRIYSCGYSDGGFMTFQLASQIGHRFAAGADIAGGLNPTTAANYNPMSAFPVLICHGTSDELVGYNGEWGSLPVDDQVNFFVQQNNCLLEADTVSLPDLDSTDNCTVEKISYTNCSDETSVLFYKIINGGHSWPSSALSWEGDGNKNRDINANVEIWNFFKNHKNPLANIAFAKTMEISNRYFQPQVDTLIINAELVNPENNPVTVYAKIIGDEDASQDSIQLFDDGLHSDGHASDNLYGAHEWLEEVSEDMHTVELSTNDLSTGTIHRLPFAKRFTTKGPIVFEKLQITTDDTTFNPGERFKFSLTLSNIGITDTVYDVYAIIVIPDTTIEETTTGSPKFGDIAPGESLTSWSRDFAISLKNNGVDCAVGQYEFGLEITSNDEVFWFDTFIIDVVTGMEEELSNLPKEFALEQNYPNPFNPSTTLKYEIPKESYITLKVYDILGREVATLVNREQKAGYYEIDWNASMLTSGIYFYRIQAGDFVDVKKMVLVK